MPRLESLPVELLMLIAESLAIPDVRNIDPDNGFSSLSRLTRCSRFLRDTLEPCLYDIDIIKGNAYSWYWTCFTGNVAVMEKATVAVKRRHGIYPLTVLANMRWIVGGYVQPAMLRPFCMWAQRNRSGSPDANACRAHTCPLTCLPAHVSCPPIQHHLCLVSRSPI